MTLIKLYIAASLDGKIARPDGGLDWLPDIDPSTGTDYGYSAFLSTVSATIMGSKTYEKILSFEGEFPYANLKNYIVTRNSGLKIDSPNTHLLVNLSKEKMKRLKEESEKDIWLIGGGEIVTEFLNMDLIDEMIIFIVPTILGEGIPLFAETPKESKWKLSKTEVFENGLVSLTYTKQ